MMQAPLVWLKLSPRRYVLSALRCPMGVIIYAVKLGQRWQVKAVCAGQTFDLLEPAPSDKPRRYDSLLAAKRAAEKHAMSAVEIKRLLVLEAEAAARKAKRSGKR